MNPELLKLLNPKSIRMDGAGGGIPMLTVDDVNAACAGADQLGLDILLAKICSDRQQQDKTFDRLYLEILSIASNHHWKIKGERTDKLKRLTQLIIYELIESPRCPKCHGVQYNRNMKPCMACQGTGYYRIKDSQRAKVLGINRSTWNRVWSFRYAQVLSNISQHETAALDSMSKKLKYRLS